MKRSILTEKIARRGLDIFRPYQVDRLEYMPVKDVMTSDIVTVPPGMSVRELADGYFGDDQKFRAYPVVDDGGLLLGVVDRSHVREWLEADPSGAARLSQLLPSSPVVAYPEESCKNVAIRAAVEKLQRIPVVTRGNHKLLGMVTRYDLLKPYTHTYDEEILHERVFARPKRAPKPEE